MQLRFQTHILVAVFLPHPSVMARHPPQACEDLAKGFKLSFHFVENPYFTNTEITKVGWFFGWGLVAS